MSHDRTGRRRAFRPSLDGQGLESRQLLTGAAAALKEAHYLLTHPAASVANRVHNPPGLSPAAPRINPGPVYNHGIAAVNTARGGASAIVAAPDGSRFRVSLNLADNQYPPALTAQTGVSTNNQVPSSVVAPQGTVRVYPMPGGQVGIIVDGSTQYQQLTIDPLPAAQRKGYAHSFGYNAAGRTNTLEVGSLQVNSGQIQAVLGYHSANLDGPLTIGGVGTVDRIAFNSLKPGAAIGVGGTLNTLDIANSVNLTAGQGINIGRDLNLFNVGGDLNLANGANFYVGRDLGSVPQPAKGTGTGSNILALNLPFGTNTITGGNSALLTPASAVIQGNLSVGDGSALVINRYNDGVFFFLGQLNKSATGNLKILPGRSINGASGSINGPSFTTQQAGISGIYTFGT